MITDLKPSWFQVIKSMFYDGGPSSTRFMYIIAGCSAALTVLALAGSYCFVYIHRGLADLSFGAALTAILTALFGFAANSHNLKHQVDARETETTSTPVSASTEDKK
jgi:predicted Zn-dependent protease